MEFTKIKSAVSVPDNRGAPNKQQRHHLEQIAAQIMNFLGHTLSEAERKQDGRPTSENKPAAFKETVKNWFNVMDILDGEPGQNETSKEIKVDDKKDSLNCKEKPNRER